MDLTQSTDYLNFENNKLAFPFINNDIVLFSCEIYKINRYWAKQKRIICITSKYVLNLKRDRDRLDENNNPDLTGLKMKRMIDVCNLGGVTKSLHPRSFEFVIHVPTEYDYRYWANNERNREEIIQSLKLAYLSTVKDNLPIYGVNFKYGKFAFMKKLGYLKQYLGKYTSSGHPHKSWMIPDSKYLITDEGIPLSHLKQSIGHDSDPDKEINIFKNEDFELIPHYVDKDGRDHHKIKKTKSADNTTFSQADFEGVVVNVNDNNPDYSSEEEDQKLKDEISDEELDLTFDINDDDFDLFVGHSETIYSKHKDKTEVKAKDFTLKKVIRETSSGKVFLAQYNANKKCYALKSIKKDLFINNYKSLAIQKEIKEQITHPFIWSFEYILQNEYRVYIVTELLYGGELETLLRKKGVLEEEQVKFYAAQLVLALGFLHEHDIVYRNLKSSSILISSDGYIKLGDFDWSGKVAKHSLSQSILHLVEYQAPEITEGKGHDQTIDWWALGVLMCQMLFYGEVVSNLEFPDGSWVSDDAKDLICKLLEKDMTKRIGANDDYIEILNHPFFSDIDTDKLLKKKIKPSYIPFVNPNDPFYVINFNLDIVKRPPRESVIHENEKKKFEKQNEVLKKELEDCIKAH